MINLQKFCSIDDCRENIIKPFTKGPWTYATDGHICIRVPKCEDIPDNRLAPDAEALFNTADHRGPYEWVDVPIVTVESTECDECDGTGKWQVDEEHTTSCDECYGLGKIEVVKPIRFEVKSVARQKSGIIEIGLSNIYLNLIRKELPNPKIGLIEGTATTYGLHIPTKDVPVKIKFDGGQGLLMPMRLHGLAP